MKQPMLLSVSDHAFKIIIIKQMRGLDWSRENNRLMVLLSLHNLEIALLAHAGEAEKFSMLKVFNLNVFQNLETKNKFNDLLNTYARLMPAQAVDMTTVLSEPENKTFDDELEGADFDGYFNLDDSSTYNPLAFDHNVRMEIENTKGVLAGIENKMNLDWVADSTVAPEPFVEVMKPILAPQKPTAKKSVQAAVKLEHFGKVLGLVVGALVTAAIMVFVPPAIPFIAAVLYGAGSTAAASIAAGVLAAMTMAACVALGSLFDYSRSKFSRQPKVSTASPVAIEDIIEKQPLEIAAEPAKLAPQSDNIHKEPSLETSNEAVKTLVAAKLSDSKHSLFHARKENPVEPKQILVRNILSYR
jgi:hypothetical protein